MRNTIYSGEKITSKKVEKSLKKVLTRGKTCDNICKHLSESSALQVK